MSKLLSSFSCFGMVASACFATAGCEPATAQPAAPNAASAGGEGASATRSQPRRRAVREAMESAADRARGCLPPGVGAITMAGAFDGPTGQFRPGSVSLVGGGAISFDLRHCVVEAFAAARVPPFHAAHFDATQTVSRNVVGTPATATPAPAPVLPVATPPAPAPVAVVAAPSPTPPAPAPAPAVTPPPPAVAATPASPPPPAPVAAAPERPAPIARPPRPVRPARPAVAAPTVEPAPLATATPAPAPTPSPVAAPAPAPATPAAATSDSAAITAVMRNRATDLRNCYETRGTRDPSLHLRVRVRFTVQIDGTVANASSTVVLLGGDETLGTEVGDCVERVVRETSFPPRATPFEVALPFEFNRAPAALAGTTSAPLATATSEMPAPTGRIDPGAVSAAIQARGASFRQCYLHELTAAPGLAGRVTLRFTVSPSGTVDAITSQVDARAGEPQQLASVARCIEGVMRTSTMPPPTGGTAQVVVPLDFGAAR